MPRSVIGPLALEAPLGNNPRKANVYRAMHIQQKKLLAIRVFSSPMGLTPESKQDFSEQIEQLKNLRHANIVRCYGGGFDKQDAYLAHELIDGESLDQALARRGRLPWETVIDYGLQIANALSYAHQQGWVHGRLRPDKLLLSAGGLVVQVNDFRRDSISNWIDPSPPTVEQYAYQPPEMLTDPPSPTAKADLYSLGAILFTMLTGHVPIGGKTVDEIRYAIWSNPPPQVTTLAHDCPVWLGAVVMQLLEKDPANRPHSGAAVVMALEQARTRTLEGRSVAEHVASGFNPVRIKGDRKEVENLLGRKPVRPPSEWLDKVFNETTGLIAGLFLITAAITWFLLPLRESTLRARAERIMNDDNPIQWNYARDAYLVPLTKRFPDSENAAWAKEQIAEIDMYNMEKRLELAARFGKEPKSEAERRYVDAARYERFGDRATAMDKYRAIITLLSDREEDEAIINLARRQLKKIEEEPPAEDEVQVLITAKMEEAEKAYAAGDTIRAKMIWESVLSLYEGNQEMISLVEVATSRLEEMRSKAEAKRTTKE